MTKQSDGQFLITPCLSLL